VGLGLIPQLHRSQGIAQLLLERTAAAIKRRPAAFPEIALTSSRDGEGIADLRASIARLLSERGQ
jgi:GTP-binding protein